ncbi:hypothetical protein CHS0354_032847 [Potamilus streckersoni]|uniref:VWFC domain-containing protein n=1 Tax=Potamilus streckersoni TaxID=2493646 RepID=A0AAE0VSQ8_9BIVA|nr:hypothetical protein CHS0354_032847 [Potamilus streckersoni]
MLFHIIATLAGLSGTVLTLNCTDWQGKPVSHGEEFYPKKEDLCFLCRCDRGFQTMCMTVSCSPPNCQKWEQVEGQCCKFKCLDNTAGPIDPEVHRPNYTGDSPGGGSGGTTVLTSDNLTDLGLRLVASTVTTFLILALLLFLIHRLRQRRLLMALRRYSRRQGRLDDVDSVSCTPDIYGLEYSSYMDPPPPYSPPKPSSIAPGEQPPPYEMVISSSQNNQDTSLPNVTSISEFQNHHSSRYSTDVANNNVTPAQEVDISNTNPGTMEIMLRLRNERNQNRLESRPSGSDDNVNSDQNSFDKVSEIPIVLSGIENRAIRNGDSFHGSDSGLNRVAVQRGNGKYIPRMSQSWAYSSSDTSQETFPSCSTFSSGYTRRVNGYIPQTRHMDCTEHLPSNNLEMHVNSSESTATNMFSIDRNNNSNAPARIVYAESLTNGQHTCGFAGTIRPGTASNVTLSATTESVYPLAMSESCHSGTVSGDLDDCSNFTILTAGDNSNQTDVESVRAVRRQETLHQLRLSHLLNSPIDSFDSPVSPLSLSPNDYPVQRSVSVTSDMSMFSVCSETGEKRQASHSGNIISNDAPYPINSYRSFLRSALNGQQSNIRVDNTINKSVSDSQNHSVTPTSSQFQGGDTSQPEQQVGNQSSDISSCIHEYSHQFINKSVKPGSERSFPSCCASDIACPSIEEACMPQDISHRALSEPGEHNSKDFQVSKSNHKSKMNRFSTGSLPLSKGPKLSILSHMSSHSGGKRSPRVKRSSSKSKDKVCMNDKRKTKQTDLVPVYLTSPCKCMDSYKEYGLSDNPVSKLDAKVVEKFRTDKCEDLMKPSTVSALNEAEVNHTYSPSARCGQECIGFLDGLHGNCHHSNSHKRSKLLGKDDMLVKTDDHGHQTASEKSWGKLSHSSMKSKHPHSSAGDRLFHEELESVLGKRRNIVLSSKSKNKKQTPKNGINFLGFSPSEFSHKEESVMENTCSYV